MRLRRRRAAAGWPIDQFFRFSSVLHCASYYAIEVQDSAELSLNWRRAGSVTFVGSALDNLKRAQARRTRGCISEQGSQQPCRTLLQPSRPDETPVECAAIRAVAT